MSGAVMIYALYTTRFLEEIYRRPVLYGLLTLVLLAIAFVVWESFYSIGPTEVGLVRRRFGERLSGDNPIAFRGEAGYQAELLMPGVRFRFLPTYAVTKHPWVQVPAGQIGLVIAQVGESLPIGAKSAVYTAGFGNFTNLETLVDVVTALDGDPLPAGDIASRLGGFKDIEDIEKQSKAGGEGGAAVANPQLIETILGSKNDQHKSYQDFQAFLDKGGKIGLQHDPLLYGAYNLNPFLVQVEQVPMLVVEQGQVAVIKSYVGLPTEDTSGAEFKFGSLVKPGHRGIWEEPLRTGKYPINPRIYQAEIVPTAILKLDWSKGVTGAHGLDARLEPIVAKSREGFIFTIDLQVLIHVPDTKAPRVISMVGSMLNLVNEVLQAAVGNLFRDKLGGMEAVKFIQSRQTVQEEAMQHILQQLAEYEVETKGVYIQDVILPQELVGVLTKREIANQEIETFKMQQKAQEQRVATEATTGKADMQRDLAKSSIGIEINKNNADARVEQARGESEFIKQTGTAEADVIRAQGVAKAEGFKAQNEAIGSASTALVNVATVLADKGAQFVPQILVLGGAGAVDGLAATLTKVLAGQAGITSHPSGQTKLPGA